MQDKKRAANCQIHVINVSFPRSEAFEEMLHTPEQLRLAQLREIEYLKCTTLGPINFHHHFFETTNWQWSIMANDLQTRHVTPQWVGQQLVKASYYSDILRNTDTVHWSKTGNSNANEARLMMCYVFNVYISVQKMYHEPQQNMHTACPTAYHSTKKNHAAHCP